MIFFVGLLFQVHEHIIEQISVRATGHSLILRLFHLRSRDQLHGLGNLGRVLDRLNASADIAKICHDSV